MNIAEIHATYDPAREDEAVEIKIHGDTTEIFVLLCYVVRELRKQKDIFLQTDLDLLADVLAENRGGCERC